MGRRASADLPHSRCWTEKLFQPVRHWEPTSQQIGRSRWQCTRLLLGWELTPATVSAISPAAAALIAEGSQFLWETVLEYLDNARNVTATADNLFIHRATLHYRLEKARAVLPQGVLDDGWVLWRPRSLS